MVNMYFLCFFFTLLLVIKDLIGETERFRHLQTY